MHHSYKAGYSDWITLGPAVVADGLLVRIFIFFHDFSYQSFFASRKSNIDICLRLLSWTTGVTLMAEKPTYSELERRIKKLEKEALEYIRKEREFNKERKLIDSGHMKRTISLMKINEELNKEIKNTKSGDKRKLERISHQLRGRIKELSCLYDISSFRTNYNYSLDGILQEIVDFIPPACRYPEITCARIILDGYEFKTKKFVDSRLKQSFRIAIHNKRIGILEVCRLKIKQELAKNPFLEEEKSLLGAIAESIARLVEREWAEIEIRKCRNRIEELVNQTH